MRHFSGVLLVAGVIASSGCGTANGGGSDGGGNGDTSDGIRVTGEAATYDGPCSGYSVRFAWKIEGTPQPATFQRRTAKGTAEFGPEEGPFIMSNSAVMTWAPETGRLTLVGASDSGPSPGFKSQITKVGGKPVTGDATSIAAPGHCQ